MPLFSKTQPVTYEESNLKPNRILLTFIVIISILNNFNEVQPKTDNEPDYFK